MRSLIAATLMIPCFCASAWAEERFYFGPAQHIYEAHALECWRKGDKAALANKSSTGRKNSTIGDRVDTTCLDNALKDFDRRSPARYTMIAYGLIDDGGDRHSYGFAWNYPDLASAAEAAIKACYRRGNVIGCSIRHFARNGCAAVARRPRGWSHGFGSGPTKEAAERTALGHCDPGGLGDCEILNLKCSGQPK